MVVRMINRAKTVLIDNPQPLDSRYKTLPKEGSLLDLNADETKITYLNPAYHYAFNISYFDAEWLSYHNVSTNAELYLLLDKWIEDRTGQDLTL